MALRAPCDGQLDLVSLLARALDWAASGVARLATASAAVLASSDQRPRLGPRRPKCSPAKQPSRPTDLTERSRSWPMVWAMLFERPFAARAGWLPAAVDWGLLEELLRPELEWEMAAGDVEGWEWIGRAERASARCRCVAWLDWSSAVAWSR